MTELNEYNRLKAVQAKIESDNARFEAEKAEKERAEIQAKITGIDNMVTGIGSLDLTSLDNLIDELEALEIDQDTYREFIGHAETVRTDALVIATEAYQEREKTEIEDL